MRSLGSTYQEISTELKVSKPTLIKWSKECECELHNEIEVQREELLKKHKLNYEGQLELKSALLSKLKIEILEGDFSKVPKDKLVQLALSIVGSIAQKPQLKQLDLPEAILEVVKWEG